MCVFSRIFVLVMKRLYLFNPENDMALASGSPYYMAPASAKKMASDLSALPSWYAEEESGVWVSDVRQIEWMREASRLSPSVDWLTDAGADFDEVVPWGWSPALLHRLRTSGVPMALPQEEKVAELRRLSSRQVAVDLLPLLQMEGTMGESAWLTSVDEVSAFSSQYDKVLLKAPWSGSGKGIQPLSGLPDDNLSGWARRVIASQGGVVGEPFYNKVEDFAMEFYASGGKVEFVGYSLFEADARGIYKENWLVSDEAIEHRLAKYVTQEVLVKVRQKLLVELPLLLGNAYQGYLGVDMMVCRVGEVYAVHPCVEVNLRMNMGVVSRMFFDRYLSPEVSGRYVIEYYPRPGDALRFHEEMKLSHPLVMHDGRVVKGYLSLTPVFEDTAYQIYVVVETEKQ